MGSLPVPDPCPNETSFAESLRALLDRTTKAPDKRLSIQAIVSSAPEQLVPVALSLLRSERNATRRREMYSTLVDYPEFLLQVVRPDLSRGQVLEICRELLHIDSLLDVRLARLLPRRYEAKCDLDTPTVTRVLDILNEISTGPRLIFLLNHLTHNPDQQIASKATLLIARRMQNNQAVENYLTSEDSRVRASTVEALWGIQTPFARRTMWACLQDPNNRVSGNALLGLHLLGEGSVVGLVEQMLHDERPLFRGTAAWVMGQIGKTEFRDSLQGALKDPELGVRQAARRALKTIHQAVLAAQPPAPQLGVAPPAVVPSLVAARPAEVVPVAAKGPSTAETPVEVLVEVPIEGAQEPARVPEPDMAPRAPEPVPAPLAPTPVTAPPAPAPQKPEKSPEPVDDGFEIRLDGSYIGSRRRR
jgi:hypothetical protein